MSLTEEQVAQRINFIGGSDAAAVLGLSRWKTPLALWAEKSGQIVPDDISGKIPIKLGNKLEQAVAELFMEETGKKVRRVNKTLIHPEYPFIGANLDREVIGEDAILECKTAGQFKSKEWKDDDIPQEYIIQVMHYLAVTGAQRGYLAVVIGNQDFKWKVVERDENMIREMIVREVSFWNDFVVPKIMPGIVTSRDSDTLYKIFPLADSESVVALGDEADRLVESRAALITDKINLESQIEKTENELKVLLGSSEAGKSAKWMIAWKNQSQIRLDTDRIKKEKPELYKSFGKETKFRKLSIKEVQANGKH